ncbi:hypothetical protein SRABI05_04813 [Agrobacterium fabrum]|nr:hypothetical protein SRABI05_04813 [Agrobacterium fabrum]
MVFFLPGFCGLVRCKCRACFGLTPDKPLPFLAIGAEQLRLAMILIFRKRHLDDSVPAFGIFLLAAITADDKMIGGAGHRHIKQPTIFIFRGRFQAFLIRANEMIGKTAAGQPDRKGIAIPLHEAQFRHMAVVEGLRATIHDKDHRCFKPLGRMHGHDAHFAAILVLLALHFR